MNASANTEYPGRALYKDVEYITLQKLSANYRDFIIVDVRSSYEYKTLHIVGSRHIPVSSSTYTTDIKELRADHPKKTIVTYCNGRTCM